MVLEWVSLLAVQSGFWRRPSPQVAFERAWVRPELLLAWMGLEWVWQLPGLLVGLGSGSVLYPFVEVALRVQTPTCSWSRLGLERADSLVPASAHWLRMARLQPNLGLPPWTGEALVLPVWPSRPQQWVCSCFPVVPESVGSFGVGC